MRLSWLGSTTNQHLSPQEQRDSGEVGIHRRGTSRTVVSSKGCAFLPHPCPGVGARGSPFLGWESASSAVARAATHSWKPVRRECRRTAACRCASRHSRCSLAACSRAPSSSPGSPWPFSAPPPVWSFTPGPLPSLLGAADTRTRGTAPPATRLMWEYVSSTGHAAPRQCNVCCPDASTHHVSTRFALEAHWKNEESDLSIVLSRQRPASDAH